MRVDTKTDTKSSPIPSGCEVWLGQCEKCYLLARGYHAGMCVDFSSATTEDRDTMAYGQ